jgi:phage-related protein
MMYQLLTAVKSLMPTLIPLVRQGAVAFGDLVHWLSSGLQSSGFISFMHLMTSLVVPATNAILKLAGALLGALGQAITQLAPLSVPFIGVLTAIIKALGGPLAAVLSMAVGLLVGLGEAIEPLLPGLSAFATMIINGIGSSFMEFMPILKTVIGLLGGAFLKILTDLAPLIENALTPNSPFMLAFQMLPGLLKAILPAFTWLAGLLAHPMFAQLAVDVLSGVVAITELIKVLGLVSKAFGLLGLAFDATPVGWVIGLLAGLVFAFYELWNHCAAFRAFWQGLWADIKAILAPVVSWIHNVITDMERWWTDHGKTVEAIVKTFFAVVKTIFDVYFAVIGGVVKAELAVIEGVFKAVWAAVQIVTETTWKVISTVVTAGIHIVYDIIAAVLDIIEGHWGAAWARIRDMASTWMHAVESVIRDIASGFITLLYSAGADLMQGLINGIKSAWGSVTGLIGGLGHDISSVFSSALSILSPSRVFFSHGMNTMLGYANGVMAGYQYVRSTMNSVSSAIASTRLGVPASAYGQAAAGYGGGSSGGSSGGGSGTITVNVNGQKLFQVMQSELYQYNVRNSGTVTGVVKPGLAA